MDERIVEHLKYLSKYLGYLEKMAKISRKEFLNDITFRGASERYLQLAIETCLNIGNRVLALQDENSDLTVPENYADIFVKLGKIGIFSEEQVLIFVNMAKFRNKLVHGYWEIEPEKIYKILQNNLVDFYQFKEGIIKYLNNTRI